MSEHVDFVHLHAHTEYSLLDGAVRLADAHGAPGDLMKLVASKGMPALAMTDHGNLFGAIEFYNCCNKAGIKPILGIEAYIAPASRLDKSGTIAQSNNHLTLLAKNEQGYQNLIKLTSLSYLEGFYYKPRMDWELLQKYHEGLIALSGCLKSKTSEAILAGKIETALAIAEKYQELFGKGNYYLELMDHGIEDQKKVNRSLLEISRKTGIPVVATNDAHYLKREDAIAHDVLLCIGTGKVLSETNRMKYATEEFYYKSPEEMAKVFSEVPQALRATVEIAEKCNLEIKMEQILLPSYQVPHGDTHDSYLEKLCMDGIRKRYGQITPQLKNRLDYELEVIKKMGFSTYFLIVWDFIQYARSQGIPIGPGRGSGAGSLVSYALEITSVDPIRYGLLFERFLNPDRRTMPDLDIDFSDDGREKVIRYVQEKYGKDSVAQIITFGSMMARLVVRDVGRVLEMPLAECDRIAKMIPTKMPISQALKQVPELKALYQQNPQVKKLLDISQRLEGLKRHTGVHAAGIVIVPSQNGRKITDYVPLARGSNEVITTQFNDDALLKLGLLKIDFLGLRTLTVLCRAEKFVQERGHPDFKIDSVPLEDKKTFKLLAEAKTTGVFQLESSGMKDLLRKLKPSSLEDIIALISLYRPGPMGSGMVNDFVARSHARSKVKYDHPLLEPTLKETYGIILYQEQVMQIAQVLAGFTPGQADILRRAMGKKIPEEISRLKTDFVEGAKKKGVDSRIAEKVFSQVEHFGGYGFNKSHATAYGLVAYQTAYLKANFPAEYMAALISSVIGHSTIAREEGTKIAEYISEAQEMGIEVLPPDLQSSDMHFSLLGEGEDTKIRFGLLAIKNVGEGAVEEILRAREEGPFLSLRDFLQRVDARVVNKKVIESLIYAGAFDFCGEPATYIRSKLFSSLEKEMAEAAKIRQERSLGQESLFGLTEMGHSKIEKQQTGENGFTDWSEHELLAHEKEVLGFYVTGHPLAKYKDELACYSTHPLGNLAANSNGGRVRVAGIIANVKRLVSKQQKAPYARFKLEDLDGEIECVVFPKSYSKGLSNLLTLSKMVVVCGRLNHSRLGDDARAELIVEDILPLEKARETLIEKIVIQVSTAGLESALAEKLKRVISEHQGKCPIYFHIHTPSHGDFCLNPNLKVKPCGELFMGLRKLLGENSWKLVPTRV